MAAPSNFESEGAIMREEAPGTTTVPCPVRSLDSGTHIIDAMVLKSFGKEMAMCYHVHQRKCIAIDGFM